jgi:PST family polysaccharide transporter
VVGFGQYVITQRETGTVGVFHATFYTLLLGILALGSLYPLRGWLGEVCGAPGVADYIPGFIVATALERLALIPESILARDLRFATLATARTCAELVFPVVAIGLAWRGWGGDALVWANVARSLVRVTLVIPPVGWRQWLTPCRLRWSSTRHLFRYGAPLGLASIAGFASRRWDNLIYSRFFGPAQMGLYNSAYNLADIPATQVGEQIGDVLLPAFASLPPAQRAPGLLRSLSLLALIMFPMAAGLGAVAHSLIAVIFNQEWQGVAPLLVPLSLLSAGTPLAWTVSVYLQAEGRTVAYMGLELGKLLFLLIAVAGLARFGPIYSSTAAGAAACLHALACIGVAVGGRRPELIRFALALLRPALACAPLVLAVIAVRRIAASLTGLPPVVGLVAEVLAGAAAYVPAALVLAPEATRDLLSLLRKNVGRGRDR